MAGDDLVAARTKRDPDRGVIHAIAAPAVFYHVLVRVGQLDTGVVAVVHEAVGNNVAVALLQPQPFRVSVMYPEVLEPTVEYLPHIHGTVGILGRALVFAVAVELEIAEYPARLVGVF